MVQPLSIGQAIHHPTLIVPVVKTDGSTTIHWAGHSPSNPDCASSQNRWFNYYLLGRSFAIPWHHKLLQHLFGEKKPTPVLVSAGIKWHALILRVYMTPTSNADLVRNMVMLMFLVIFLSKISEQNIVTRRDYPVRQVGNTPVNVKHYTKSTDRYLNPPYTDCRVGLVNHLRSAVVTVPISKVRAPRPLCSKRKWSHQPKPQLGESLGYSSWMVIRSIKDETVGSKHSVTAKEW